MNKLAKNPVKIQTMFSAIAPRYDLINKLLSFGRDRYWRRFAVGQLPAVKDGLFLDAATGTGDVALEIVKQRPLAKVTGVDFSDKMIAAGKEKILKTGSQDKIELRIGDITALPFEDKTFDAAIIAFGIRNIPDYKKGLMEMARVVKDGGRIVVLEFTSVQNRLFEIPFRLYLTKLLPAIGSAISGRKGAYEYLSSSVIDFPRRMNLKIMVESGLKEVRYYPLTFSIVTVHVGVKNNR